MKSMIKLAHSGSGLKEITADFLHHEVKFLAEKEPLKLSERAWMITINWNMNHFLQILTNLCLSYN